jgi:surface protein
MPNYELELSPTNTPTEGGEGSLDTSLLDGNSIQRTGYITTVDGNGNTKTLNLKDGTAFDSTPQGLGDVLGIILVSDDAAFAATVEIGEDNFTLTMPYWSEGTYSGTINWGDESTSANAIGADHTYATAGTYSIAIDGEITGWFTYDNDEVVDDVNGNIHEVLISIDAFGSNFDFGTYAAQTNGSLFDGCSLLESIATDIPTENVTTMRYMFYECTVFNGSLSFDTSSVTDMRDMFYYCENFNQPLSFDTSSVTDMSSMFEECFAFNQDLSFFDTSNVTNMSSMFYVALNFNQPLSFDTSNVTDMRHMFGISSFNQDLSAFDTSSVTDMSSMFSSCSAFNQPLSSFDTSSVTDMSSMFSGCSSFNQDLSSFDTSNVTDMSSMFSSCSAFNQPLSFDTSSVTNMSSMFSSCSAFNQPLSSFDTSNVTNINGMFEGCSSFNQDLSFFDTSNVTDMGYMFYFCSVFNQDLSNWCVSLIPSEQVAFSENATAWVLPKPIWGAACA